MSRSATDLRRSTLGAVRDEQPHSALIFLEPDIAEWREGGDPSSFDAEGTPQVAGAIDFATRHGRGSLRPLALEMMALVVSAVAAAGMSSLAHASTLSVQSRLFTTTLVRLIATVPLMLLFLALTKLRRSLRITVSNQLPMIAMALAVATGLAIVGWETASAVGLVFAPPIDALLMMSALSVAALSAVRTTGRGRMTSPGRSTRLLVVGSGPVADRVCTQLRLQGGVEIIGCVDDEPLDPSNCLGPLRALTTVCEREAIDHVLVAFSKSPEEDLVHALRGVQGRVPITVVPRMFDLLPTTATLDDLGFGFAGITIATATLDLGPRFVKRLMDIVGAATALLVASPLLLLTAVAIKMTSPGPVLFRQVRGGQAGKHFEVLKFRSMYSDAPARHPSALGTKVKGLVLKAKGDPRITPVGRIIRRLSIDELPQLWNVLRGEMSLIGPRPLPLYEDEQILGWAERRYAARPGISGLWQVSGRSELSFEEMCRLDSLYVSYWSIGLDLRILARTVRVVFNGIGAR